MYHKSHFQGGLPPGGLHRADGADSPGLPMGGLHPGAWLDGHMFIWHWTSNESISYEYL